MQRMDQLKKQKKDTASINELIINNNKQQKGRKNGKIDNACKIEEEGRSRLYDQGWEYRFMIPQLAQPLESNRTKTVHCTLRILHRTFNIPHT